MKCGYIRAANPKVLIIAGYDRSLVNFRGPLLTAMRAAGCELVGVAPAENKDVPPALSRMGVRFAPVPFARASISPVKDLQAWNALRRLFRRERPDIVLAYTIKPVIFGMTAAAVARVPRRFALITGLGAAFFTRGLKGRILRVTAIFLYRLALGRVTRVFVQNGDIAAVLQRSGALGMRTPVVVVRGSGVDLEHYRSEPFPLSGPVFLLLARMLRDKGVEEFVAAARMAKARIPAARFLLVGDIDPNPAAIGAEQLQRWHEEGVIEYRPGVTDVRPLLRDCTTFVLPSYHEGLPRSVLEAMATGRPIITTNTIGCRDTIFETRPGGTAKLQFGRNGILVPVRSVAPLAEAMVWIAEHPDASAAMGSEGRRLAEKHFDVRLVNRQMLEVMGVIQPATDSIYSRFSPATH